jgi:predicted TIM-barrel fold metal-dependent hydrolase
MIKKPSQKDTTDRPQTENEGRRDFLKTAALGAVGGLSLSGLGGLSLGAGMVTAPSAAKAEVKRNGKTFKVIDWRCRPPLKPYEGLYKLRKLQSERPTKLANPASHGKVPPVIDMVDKPGAMEEWWKEIDKAGVDIVVANGRWGAGLPQFTMDNETLIKLQKEYPGRFLGLAMLNLDQPIKKTVDELEKAIKGGLRGANIEPGYRTKNGGATTIDNADFYPIFETMIDADLPLMVQTGAFAGIYNWNEANQIWRFDSVLVKFPKLKLVLGHGGYPRVTEALALALKHPTAYICPDVYMFWPGGQPYQQNLSLLPDQFIYGSAFPFANIDTALEQTLALPVSDEVMSQYLYGNAARILKL